jgi:hypothetical protein
VIVVGVFVFTLVDHVGDGGFEFGGVDGGDGSCGVRVGVDDDRGS